MNVETIGKYAGLLALSEICLGSTLHALHIPFTGTCLALNQIFLLSLSARHAPKKAPFLISGIAALLKSLSPSGKKLTPMIAIAMQGFLFNCGTFLFGGRALGLMIGATLASLWGTAQSLLLYYLIFGNSLIEALHTVSKEISQEFSFYQGLTLFLVLKATAAIIVSLSALLLPKKPISAYLSRLSALKPTTSPSEKPPLLLALKDLTRPFFLTTLTGISLFDAWKAENFHSLPLDVAKPLLIGFVCFYALRKFPLKKIASRKAQTSQGPFAQALKIAVEEIEKAN
ncbi:MAG: hypothetical protein ACK5MA_02340 [Parachlamydiaceae bacterium]